LEKRKGWKQREEDLLAYLTINSEAFEDEKPLMNCSFEKLLLESWNKNDFIRAVLPVTSNNNDNVMDSQILLECIVGLLKVWKNNFSGHALQK
jgi:hypothetical protein